MKQNRIGVALLLFTFTIVGAWDFSLAQVGPYQTITAPEVKSMMDGNKAILVHTLSEIEFQIQHIPGSINIPITKMRTTDKLPKNKSTPLIFYCMGQR